MRWLLVTAVICTSFGLPSPALQISAAQGMSADEYVVVGTVISVHPATGSIVIREANLFGRLHFQIKTYQVKQTRTLGGLRPGDRIIAFYSKKDGMLHRIRESRVPAKDKAPAARATP